ncbi:MAG: Dps family protein [Ostreibacterium sp.]
MDIGINETDRKAVAEQLKVLLADSYTLYLQTHNFHWNVTGPRFRDLHLMFEEHYIELSTAVDDVAERIRTLGVFVPGTYQSLSTLSNIKSVEDVPIANDMVNILMQNHEQVVKTCRKALKTAQGANDESSESLIADRMVVHEKTAWMLRSLTE